MNMFDPKRSVAAFANFSESKRGMLNDIRSKWEKLSEEDIEALGSNDELVSEIAVRYNIDKAQAQRDVDAVMQGRQI